MATVIQFLKEVRIELGRVAWPTNQQLMKYTGIVVAMSLALAGFLGALDAVFAYILGLIL
jgi:preprotein translocase subunit SecE